MSLGKLDSGLLQLFMHEQAQEESRLREDSLSEAMRANCRVVVQCFEQITLIIAERLTIIAKPSDQS